ncbi:hypothetical protein Tco_1113270 [Tanacetum coccineum]|uniref:Uncharacterized protein n=1 Tax=Tanacetum coccineum TaxID=301880 RepID=A0ABQ5IRT1_9ASTR
MIELRETFQAWLQQRQEQVVNLDSYTHEPSQCQKIPIYYDDDDDEETVDSLIMEDEHLDTIPATESDEFIESSAENLFPTASESEDASDGVCDLPVCDDFPKSHLVTFYNPLFDIDDDCTSSDDESFSEEDVPMENFNIFSNPLFDLDEEIVPTEVDLIQNEESLLNRNTSIDSSSRRKTYSNPLFDLDEEIISSEFNLIHNEDPNSTPKNDRFDTESYLLESLLNRDTLMASSPKIDSLFEEFAGELITIPPRIVNRENEEYISLLERLLYDNSSPRPPEAFQANSDTIIESLPTFPIPVKDSDSLREEIDIFLGPDDSIPLGIESDNDVVEDIPVDVANILPTHPTLHMDFDFIPSNDLGSDHDVSSPSGDRNKIYDPGICIEVESTRFLATHSPVIDTLLPFSSENCSSGLTKATSWLFTKLSYRE